MEKGHSLKWPNYAKMIQLFNMKLSVLHAAANAEKNDTLRAKIEPKIVQKSNLLKDIQSEKI